MEQDVQEYQEADPLFSLQTQLHNEIKKRKSQESTMQDYLDRLNLALQASKTGVWSWNVDEDVSMWDESMHQLFGLPLGAFDGSDAMFLSCIHPDDREKVVSEVQRAVKNNRKYDIEYRVVWPDGSIHDIAARADVFDSIAGKPVRMIGVCMDITEKKRAQHALKRYTDLLKKQNEKLDRSNKELDDFAYIASHDLKEPLRGIRNYSSFLLEDLTSKVDETAEHYLHRIAALAERMELFISRLFEYSRINRLELEFEDVDLDHVLKEVLQNIDVRIRENKIDIRVPAPLPTIRCDRTIATEVLQNLILNASIYNDKPEKWIEIGKTTNAKNETVLYVKDNGIGIPEKHMQTIFKIFKRLHASDKYQGGSGAGLTIVQKMVERHSGEIWVQSEEGVGSCFYFTLRDK